MSVKETDVFTPTTFPEYTYIEQTDKDLETNLERGLKTPGEIISLSGPSKSGKTVLIQRVVNDGYLIKINGGNIETVADLWNNILDQLGVPHSTEISKGEATELTLSAKIISKLGLDQILSVGGEVGTTTTESVSTNTLEQYDRRGVTQVVEDLRNEDYLVLIDNFHHINQETQKNIAQVIREFPEHDILIGVALVPHRSEAFFRANSDLRGRTNTLDIGYWKEKDLIQIGKTGFSKLGVNISDNVLKLLAKETAGSPQLMQRLCLEMCFEKNIENSKRPNKSINVSEKDINSLLTECVRFAKHEDTVNVLNSGKPTRGKSRTNFQYVDGSEGDYYNCILRAISIGEPKRSLHVDEVKERLSKICKNKTPSTQSIKKGCKYMIELAEDKLPDENPIDWKESTDEVHIPDPYFLYYLRWTNHIGGIQNVDLN